MNWLEVSSRKQIEEDSSILPVPWPGGLRGSSSVTGQKNRFFFFINHV